MVLILHAAGWLPVLHCAEGFQHCDIVPVGSKRRSQLEPRPEAA